MNQEQDIRQQQDSLPVCKQGLVHRGVHSTRLDYDQRWHGNRRETAFALAWERENAQTGELRVASSPEERALLEELLVRPVTLGPLREEEILAPYDQHAAEIAATVMQWLGTNVGFHWLERTLKDAGYTVTRDK